MYSFVQDRFSHIGVEEFICACSEDRDNNGVSKAGLNLLFPPIIFEQLILSRPKDIFFNEILYFQNCNSNKMVSNLESYVQWFNRLSYLVATEICSVSTFFSFFRFVFEP